MKSIIFSAFLITFTINAQAQRDAKPMHLGAFKVIFSRLNQLDWGTIITDMDRDGVKERSFTFTATGAAIYDHELDGNSIFTPRIAGRSAGFQILPFSVRLNGDQVSFTTSVVGMKRMNANLQDINSPGAGANEDLFYAGDLWAVIDNIEAVKVEYNRDDFFQKLQEVRITGDFDANFDPFGFNSNSAYFVIKAGMSPLGIHRTTLRPAPGIEYRFGGMEQEFRYGGELNLSLKNNSFKRFKIGGLIYNRWSHESSNGSIWLSVGEDKGGDELVDHRTHMYLEPYAEFSTNLSKKPKYQDKPTRNLVTLGVRANAYVPMINRLKMDDGSVIDLKVDVPAYGKLTMFLNF